MASVEEFITSTFRGAELLEAHHNMLQYQLKSRAKLSYIFGQLEKAKSLLNIEDYSVSQTTLDQVRDPWHQRRYCLNLLCNFMFVNLFTTEMHLSRHIQPPSYAFNQHHQ